MSSREQSGPTADRQVTVRATPKLVPFLVSGVLAALLVAVVVVLVTEPAEDYTTAASLGYLTFVFSLPGLAVAAALWLFLERRSRRRARTHDAVVAPAPGLREDQGGATGAPSTAAPTERTTENGPR